MKHEHEEDSFEDVKLSERTTVKFKPLNAFEMIQADDIVGGGDTNDAKVNKVYALCSVREINSTKVHPLRNRLEFASLAQRIDGAELFRLMMITNKQLAASMPDDLKNELAALASG